MESCDYNKLFDEISNIKNTPKNIQKVLYLLNSKYLKSVDSEDYMVVRDIVSGVWSGFPKCCVHEYSINKNYGTRSRMRNMNNPAMMLNYQKAQYVPCDECLKTGNIVENIVDGVFSINNGIWTFIIFPNMVVLNKERK